MGCAGSEEQKKNKCLNSNKGTKDIGNLPSTIMSVQQGKQGNGIDSNKKNNKEKVLKQKGKDNNSKTLQNQQGFLGSIIESEIQLQNLSQIIEQDEDDDIFASQRATSKIYKHSKVFKKESMNLSSKEIHNKIVEGKKKLKGYEINLETTPDLENQILEGVILEQPEFSKITIYSSNIALEFTIPKTRAGPYVVPLIDYSKYLSQIL